MDNEVVSPLEHGGHEKKDPFLRAVMNQDALRAGARVEVADPGPQGRASLRLRVAEPESQELLLRARLQGQELLDAQGFAVGSAEVELHAELVLGKVALERERRQLHGLTVRIFRDRGKTPLPAASGQPADYAVKKRIFIFSAYVCPGRRMTLGNPSWLTASGKASVSRAKAP